MKHFILVFLLCVSCHTQKNDLPTPQEQIMKTFPKEVIALIKTPDRVLYQTKDTAPFILNADQVKKIQTILFTDKSYWFHIQKKCLFIKDNAFIFEKDDEPPLTINVSLACKQIQMLYGNFNFIVDIDPAYEQFTSF